MKQIQLHKEAGIRIYDDAADETVYLDTLEQAAVDAELTLDWIDPHVVRIFPLEDGRIAVVRETPVGLRQEAASPTIQTLVSQLATKVENMVQQWQSRRDAEASADEVLDDN